MTAFLIGLSSCGKKDERSSANETLWYKQPAGEWEEALPLGNGRMGAMVYGGVVRERLLLNEESLWAGEKFESVPDDYYQNLRLIQDLVIEGHQVKADSLGRLLLTKKPTSKRPYQPLGNIYIDMAHDGGNYTDYRRALDMRDGISRVSYKINGTEYVREYLLSAEDDVLAMHLSSSEPGAISGKITITRWKDAKVTAAGNNRLKMDGQIIDPENHPDDPNPGGSGPGGKHMKFAGRMSIMNKGGSVSSRDTTLIVNEADEATILFTAATDYNLHKMNFDRDIDPAKKAESILARTREKSWEAIKKAHLAEHRSLFDRVSIDLGSSKQDTLPTDERLNYLKSGVADPGLMEQYFQYGRYLLMSSSRSPGRLPPSHVGLWNKHKWPPWEADYKININHQMKYWPADQCNLSPTLDPLVGWLKELSESGSNTAKRLYKADGWLCHHATTPFGRTTPCGSTLDSQFDNGVLDPLPGAWMAMTLWRHYEYSQDEAYLREVYPVLKGAARFIADILVEDENGNMVIVPSTSAENAYIEPQSREELRITKASTYHMSIARAIFNAVINSSSILKRDSELRSRLKELKGQFPPFKIGEDGTLQEWIKDYEEADPGHRHLSHLLGLYPFSLITPQQPELYSAAEKAVERRVSHGAASGWGWSTAHVASAYARLGKGDEAFHYIHELLTDNRDNLFNGTNPFEFDSNFGGTSGIAEMLLQSNLQDERGNYIVHLLPALPSTWPDGEVKGLKARGGFEVDMTWKEGELTTAKIKSSKDGVLKLKYRDETFSYEVEAGELISFQPD